MVGKKKKTWWKKKKRNEIFPAISLIRNVTVTSNCSPPVKPVNPEDTQEGKNTCHLAAIRLQPLPLVSPEETQEVKHRILVPDS